MDGNTVPVVMQVFDANNLGQIFAIHWVIRKCKRESDEKTHALVVVTTVSMKIKAAFGDVDADGKICKVFVACLGGTGSQHLA